MPLPGHIFPPQDGVRGINPPETISRAAALALHSHGYRFCVRYVRRDKPHASALSTAEANTILNGGLGLMLVQYVESESAWTPTAKKGATNGGVAASEGERKGGTWGGTSRGELAEVAGGRS